MKIVKQYFKYIFKIYSILATLYFSLLIIFAILGQFIKYYNYVEFPNKAKLMYVGLFKDEFILKDKNNGILVNPSINDIFYNNDYVYGWNSGVNSFKNKYFIYYKDWHKAELFTNYADYHDRLDELSIDRKNAVAVDYYHLINTNLKKLWLNEIPIFKR